VIKSDFRMEQPVRVMYMIGLLWLKMLVFV
jgi:hypothetical protein